MHRKIILNRRDNGALVSAVRKCSGHVSQMLPKLPVPMLKATINRYLRMLSVIATESEFNDAQKLAHEFVAPGGYGEKLQVLLEERSTAKDNWLSDWWLKIAYLDFRNPLPLYGSPGMSFKPRNFLNQNDQFDYSGKFVHALVQINDRINRNEIPVDRLPDGKSLEMIQYYHCFGTTRLPGIETDKLKLACDREELPRHIIVIHNGHVFKVDVYDANGDPYSATEISSLLRRVRDKSLERTEFPVGIFTTDNRTSWAENYNELITDETNRRSLGIIEKSFFALCLDKAFESEKSEEVESASQMLHGGGSHKNSGNRWFDKAIQVCVNENGSSGFSFDHTPCDGPPIATIIEVALNSVDEAYRSSQANASSEDTESVSGTFPEHLDFKLSDSLKRKIHIANERVDQMVADHDFYVLRFSHFGKEFGKSLEISPDSLIQIAMQLAFWKMHGELTPTYETGMTRQFRLGRTETIRLPTPESALFVRTFDDPNVSKSEKIQHFMDAIQSHQEYRRAAVSGFGIDRHLVGLKLIALEHGLKIPEFFNHETYRKMLHMKLSTSQVPNKQVKAIAFSPLVPDGYGIFYNPQHSEVTFAISALNSCSDTSAVRFAECLETCKLNMKKLVTDLP